MNLIAELAEQDEVSMYKSSMVSRPHIKIAKKPNETYSLLNLKSDISIT